MNGEKMKLLFVVDSFRGGAGNVIQILAREFTNRGYRCTVLLTNGKRADPKYDLSGIEIIEHKFDDYVVASNPIDRIMKYKREMKKLFHEIKPDAIVSFLTTNNVLSCMANDMDIPLVVSERIDPAKAETKLHWRILRRLYYGKAKSIVVQCSNFASFCGGQFMKTTKVIPNPILNPNVCYQIDEHKNKIVFVSIGRIAEQKNFPWMCDQMKRIHECVPNSELRIYGNGDQLDNLRKYIEDNNMERYIKLMGYTDEPYSELVKADIFLMTSDYEGFPNALSEAMAVGLPSVTRLCHEGIRELVEDGVNGFVTEMNATDEFVEIAVQLAKNIDLRKGVSKEAKKVSELYSIENVTTQWERALKNVTVMK